MNFVPSLKRCSVVDVVKQVRLQQEQALKDFLMMLQLQPDESYAFSFVITPAAEDATITVPQTIGYPEVLITHTHTHIFIHTHIHTHTILVPYNKQYS